MELKEFIKETLVQITQGIEDANKDLKNSSAQVNPKNVMTYTRGDHFVMRLDVDKEHKNFVDFIEFDVVACAKDGKATKGGLGIIVGAFALGTQGQSANSSGKESRIKFRIPMLLPTSE